MNEDHAESCEDLPAVNLTVYWYTMGRSMGALDAIDRVIGYAVRRGCA